MPEQTKDRVLALLEAHRGTYISGAQIAASLAVSRNAVWKAINALRQGGYRIDAVTNQGYCLAAENDVLSVQGILPLLGENSRGYADLLRLLDAPDSTNRAAKELALAGAPHGTVLLADSQSNGHGRFTRSFFSPRGGLYMSVILHPERLHFAHITAVTAFAAVAVCEAIEAVTGEETEIKWVNDILIGGKKVCGILTEAVTDFESGSLGWIVLGIGINVQAKQADFPNELREAAASVGANAPANGLRNRLAAEIIDRVLGWTEPPQEAELFRRYRKRLRMLGEQVTVVQGETSYPARAVGLDDAGHLIVENADGVQQILTSGEVRRR